MTQNEKDILLKDLCARLPYKVKVQIKNVSKICTLEEIDCNSDEMSVAVKHENGELNGYDFDLAKPYLFPMSSMTEEQNYEMMSCSSEDCLDHMEMLKSLRECTDFTHWPLYEYRVIDWFNKNHFDYRGLIPMGLANDATDKNIY